MCSVGWNKTFIFNIILKNRGYHNKFFVPKFFLLTKYDLFEVGRCHLQLRAQSCPVLLLLASARLTTLAARPQAFDSEPLRPVIGAVSLRHALSNMLQ